MEEQAEEFEVLDSIYGSDDCFKSLSGTVFQYKFGEEGEISSFLLEIRWPEDYPSVIPQFNLDAFYNQHLSGFQKSTILKLIRDESENNKGEVQTYTVIEWVRDNNEMIKELVKSTTNVSVSASNCQDSGDYKELGGNNENVTVPKIKKEQLSKSQKRKEWDRVDSKGEKPRGYDWVDVIKHLSQTGQPLN